MAVDPEYVEHVLELFSGLGPLRTGRMFSGVAVYAEEDVMVAMISSDQIVYMKSDDDCRAEYEAAGSEPFSYTRGSGEQRITSLMSLPESAMDDPTEALDWARRSMVPAREAAQRKRAEKARKAARKADRDGARP